MERNILRLYLVISCGKSASLFIGLYGWIVKIGSMKSRLEPLGHFSPTWRSRTGKITRSAVEADVFLPRRKTWSGSIGEVSGALHERLLHCWRLILGKRSCSWSSCTTLLRRTTKSLLKLASDAGSSTNVCGSDSIRRQVTITGKLTTLSRRNLNFAI